MASSYTQREKERHEQEMVVSVKGSVESGVPVCVCVCVFARTRVQTWREMSALWRSDVLECEVPNAVRNRSGYGETRMRSATLQEDASPCASFREGRASEHSPPVCASSAWPNTISPLHSNDE
jgi:hypothetical protein